MAEVKLGSKHECSACSTKFYDLGKPETVCPSCGAEVAEENGAESKASSKSKKKG